MLYIIDAGNLTKDQLQKAISTLTPDPPDLTPIVRDNEGRTTPIHVVAEFYDEQFRHEFPELVLWDRLSNQTQSGIALTMAGYIAWQFPEHYRMELAETFSDVTNAFPETLAQAMPVNENSDTELLVQVAENYAALIIEEDPSKGAANSATDPTADLWNGLPETERNRLVDVCQQALDKDHSATIIDILRANIA